MIKRQVLIIMGDSETSQLLQACIECFSIEVDCAKTLSQALKHVMHKLYCLLVIDLQMLCMENKELIRIFRTAKHTPILALTEVLDPQEKIDLFHIGVDAFLEKPVDVNICAAQVHALIELSLESDNALEKSIPIIFGTSLLIAPRYRQVLVDGETVELTRKEFDLLHFLAQYPGQVFNREQIYDNVWGDCYESGGSETVKTHIKTLRKKLSGLGTGLIENVWGVGYRFIPPK